jgi:methylated-DNA-[protein]-cysteine S-methyltransferase
VGDLTVVEEEGAIVALDWGRKSGGEATALLALARAQLGDYFSHKINNFDLPLRPEVSPFQARVLRVMQEIPYGKTKSYGDLAGWVSSSARAVGRACGANPIPIIIPCHRVIAKTGDLGGYSGLGGTRTKKVLLAHEGVDFGELPIDS